MRPRRAEPLLAAGRNAALAGLSAISLAACSFAPKYAVPDLPVNSQYKAVAAPVPVTGGAGQTEAGWMAAAPADRLPRGNWWSLYGDAELDALAARVETGSPDLAAALARYEQASAYRDEARSALFPSFSIDGSAERRRNSKMAPPSGSSRDRYTDANLELSGSYELDLWSRVRNAVRAGDAEFAASSADLESAHLSLRATLVDDYVQLRGLDIEAKLLADTVVAYEKALELTSTRHAGGITSGLDVARARTQLQTAKAQVSTTAAQRALFEHAIAVLVGESPSRFALAPRTEPLVLPTIPLEVPASLLQRRPDIAAAERRTAAANASVGVARAAWFPTLSLGGSVGYSSFEGSDWFKASNLFWSIGPTLAIDLFNGGLRDAQIRRARAALNEAGASYRGTALRAFAEVEDNLSLLDHYRNAAEEEALAVEAAQKAVDYATTRYREGAVNYLEVTTAQTAALEAQRSSVSLQTSRLRASVGLIRALGGGWTRGDDPLANTVGIAAQAAPPP